MELDDNVNVLPEQPVLSIPPIVAPGAGSSYARRLCQPAASRGGVGRVQTGKNNGMPKNKRKSVTRYNPSRTKLTFFLQCLIEVHPTNTGLADHIRVTLYEENVRVRSTRQDEILHH